MPSGYLSINGIDACLIHIANTYPGLSQLIVLPEPSAEGRTIRAVKLSGKAGDKKAVTLLVGGLHARELVNPDALAALALKLCTAYSTNTGISLGGKSYNAALVKSLLDNSDIYILPLVNPDGRAYVQSPTGDIMWRKNRRPIPGTNEVGVDINRNFDFLWESSIGASVKANEETYKGTSAFSEPETRNVRWMLDTYPITCFMDIHSYSELVLYSWGDDNSQTSDANMNFKNPAYNGVRGTVGDTLYKEYIPTNDQTWYVNTGTRIRDAIAAVRGRKYKLEPAVGLYPTSATSDDYTYSRHFVSQKVRKVFAFTVETGKKFQPNFPEASHVMNEAMAGALEFCVAGA